MQNDIRCRQRALAGQPAKAFVQPFVADTDLPPGIAQRVRRIFWARFTFVRIWNCSTDLIGPCIEADGFRGV